MNPKLHCESLMGVLDVTQQNFSSHLGSAMGSHSPAFLTAVMLSLLRTIKVPPGRVWVRLRLGRNSGQDVANGDFCPYPKGSSWG